MAALVSKPASTALLTRSSAEYGEVHWGIEEQRRVRACDLAPAALVCSICKCVRISSRLNASTKDVPAFSWKRATLAYSRSC